MNKRLTVIVGGPSPEHDVSILTGLQAARALSQDGYDTSVLYWSKQGRWSLHEPTLEASAFADGVPNGGKDVEWQIGADSGLYAKGRLRSSKVEIDVALIGCHGAPGEDGTLQALLELAGVNYTGPTVGQAALCMDKLAFAAFAASLGLPVAKRILISAGTPISPMFDGPYVLKPRFGGSSLGVEIVTNFDNALGFIKSSSLYADGAYLEEHLDGWYDVNVAMRNFPQHELSQFERPIGKGAGALSYEDKYVMGEGMAGAAREVPAELSPELHRQLVGAASAIAAALPARGVMRLDFMTDGTNFMVNELNSLPGSWSKYLWSGTPQQAFKTLLHNLIQEAAARPVGRWTSQGADGRLLRDAQNIAAKLA